MSTLYVLCRGQLFAAIWLFTYKVHALQLLVRPRVNGQSTSAQKQHERGEKTRLKDPASTVGQMLHERLY